MGKLVRMVEGGKFHRRQGKTHFPCELLLWQAGAAAQPSNQEWKSL
jgi:NADH dehydrogenase FAD-containing subunit